MSTTDRRTGPSTFWRLLGWLLRERRGGFDRRARAEEPRVLVVCPKAASKCWSCKRPFTLGQRAEADGNCPHCGVEIELDEGVAS